MMDLIIRTWHTTGQEWSGSPCRFRGGAGYDSVPGLRTELKRRWADNYHVADIENGVEIVPKEHHRMNCYHGKQQVTLDIQ